MFSVLKNISSLSLVLTFESLLPTLAIEPPLPYLSVDTLYQCCLKHSLQHSHHKAHKTPHE